MKFLISKVAVLLVFLLVQAAPGDPADLLLSDEADAQDVAEARELARSVRDAVDMLSPSNRGAKLMYYFDQPTVREIALHLGISISAVKGRLHKSRNILRETLEPLTALLEGVSARA